MEGNMQQHYFKISKEGVIGLLLVKGSVAAVSGLLKNITKKDGTSAEELNPTEADKLRAQLEE
jgi:Tfp pilus assembly PilM family ATPase